MSYSAERSHNTHDEPVGVPEALSKNVGKQETNLRPCHSTTDSPTLHPEVNTITKPKKRSSKKGKSRAKNKASVQRLYLGEIPSKVVDRKWLHASSRNHCEPRTQTIIVGGVWLIFINKSNSDHQGLSEHDKAWFKISDLVKNSKLWRASSSTAVAHLEQQKGNEGVINVYLPPEAYKDIQEIKKTANVIASALKMECNMIYKMDCPFKGNECEVSGHGNNFCIYKADRGEFFWRCLTPELEESVSEDGDKNRCDFDNLLEKFFLRMQVDWWEIYCLDKCGVETASAGKLEEPKVIEEHTAGEKKDDCINICTELKSGMSQEINNVHKRKAKKFLKNDTVEKKKDQSKNQIICDKKSELQIQVPSMVTEKAWITVKFYKYYMDKAQKVPPNLKGMWLIFSNTTARDSCGYTSHDKRWFRICELINKGKLWMASCTTARTLRTQRSEGLINVATRDYNDIVEVERTAQIIKAALNFKATISYKTVNASHCARYTKEKNNRTGCMYKHTEQGALLRLDTDGKWKRVHFKKVPRKLAVLHDLSPKLSL